MPTLEIGGHPVHWREHGRGDVVLLVHGLGSSGADWAFQILPLAERFRVIAPDLRGSGRSSAARGPFSVAQFAADLWALLDALDIEHAHLVGFSLGGAVALEMALAQPARARSLVTINSLPSYRIDHWRKWMEVHVQATMVRVLGLPRVARMVGARLFPLPHQAPMRDRVLAVLAANPPRAYLDTVRALAGWCAGERLAQLRTPTLMIAAEHDYTALAEKHVWAERMGAQLAVVRGSRHGTPFDAVNATNALLLAFLGGTPLPTDDTLEADLPEQMPSAPPVGVLLD
jgi:pimeloyl-ACP methyl ester carboxylesterase